MRSIRAVRPIVTVSLHPSDTCPRVAIDHFPVSILATRDRNNTPLAVS